MPAIAFLSTDNLEDFFVYDELLIRFSNNAGGLLKLSLGIAPHQIGISLTMLLFAAHGIINSMLKNF